MQIKFPNGILILPCKVLSLFPRFVLCLNLELCLQICYVMIQVGSDGHVWYSDLEIVCELFSCYPRPFIFKRQHQILGS